MKKVFTLIAFFVLLLNYSNGQIRLTEVNPKGKYFELFYSGEISLTNYKIFIWSKVGSAESIIVGRFKPNMIHYGNQSQQNSLTQGAVVYSAANVNLEDKKSGTALHADYQKRWSDYLSTTLVFDKYVKSANNFTLNSTVDDLFVDAANNADVAVLLYNGSKITDFVVDKTSNETSLRAIGSLYIDNQTIDFSQITVTSDKLVNQALGSGAFQSTYVASNVSTTNCSTVWDKSSTGSAGTPLTATPGWAYGYSGNFSSWANSTYYVTPTGQPSSSINLDNKNISLATAAIPSSSTSVEKTGNDFYLTYYTRVYNTSGTTPDKLTYEFYDDQQNAGTGVLDQTDALMTSVVFGGVTYSTTDLPTTNDVITNNSNFITSNDVTGVYYKVRFKLTVTNTSQAGTTTTYNFSDAFLKISSSLNSCFTSTTRIIIGSFAGSTTPVTLSKLNLSNSKNSNNLNWTTSTESNNKGFEVQRSIGNTNDFKTIGFVGTRAKDGNSQTEINYSFEDTDVKPGQTHFYRLNQIDFDGKSAFSPVKSIKPGSIESNLNVYPNPSKGSFTVNTGSTSGKLNIFVMDNTGRVVNQYMNVSTTNTKISNLKKGFYTLKIVNTESGEQSAQRVVVQ